MEFNLGKTILVMTVFILAFAAIGTIDFDADTSGIELFLNDSLELKNWHYYLLLWIIFISGGKSCN